jgi:hypothetical protein
MLGKPISIYSNKDYDSSSSYDDDYGHSNHHLDPADYYGNRNVDTGYDHHDDASAATPTTPQHYHDLLNLGPLHEGEHIGWGGHYGVG